MFFTPIPYFLFFLVSFFDLLLSFYFILFLFIFRLAKTIEEEGGVDKIIITHSDNIQDHDKWKNRFPNAQRIMHR